MTDLSKEFNALKQSADVLDFVCKIHEQAIGRVIATIPPSHEPTTTFLNMLVRFGIETAIPAAMEFENLKEIEKYLLPEDRSKLALTYAHSMFCNGKDAVLEVVSEIMHDAWSVRYGAEKTAYEIKNAIDEKPIFLFALMCMCFPEVSVRMGTELQILMHRQTPQNKTHPEHN